MRPIYLAIALSALLTGCVAPVAPTLFAPPSVFASDRGAAFKVTLQLPARRLMATAASTPADIEELSLYLVEASATAPPSGALSPVPGSEFVYTLKAGNLSSERVDVTYDNLSANATGRAYYLAVTATGPDGDVLNLAAPATIGALRSYVSDGGGNGDAPGSVRVSPVSYALDDLTPLTIGLKLLDATP